MSKQNHIKYKKAPQAPRRFKSSYMFYSTEKHKSIRKELAEKGETDKSTTEVAKLVSQAWKDLSEEEREVWEEMARKDKARYEMEKTMYKGPWKVPAKGRSQKDPTAPKRPMSAFLSFSNSKRAYVKDKHPNTGNAEISRILAQMWKEASGDERKEHVDKEFKLRQEYKLAIAEWRRNSESEFQAARKEREDQAMKAVLEGRPAVMSDYHAPSYHGGGGTTVAPPSPAPEPAPHPLSGTLMNMPMYPLHDESVAPRAGDLYPTQQNGAVGPHHHYHHQGSVGVFHGHAALHQSYTFQPPPSISATQVMGPGSPTMHAPPLYYPSYQQYYYQQLQQPLYYPPQQHNADYEQRPAGPVVPPPPPHPSQHHHGVRNDDGIRQQLDAGGKSFSCASSKGADSSTAVDHGGGDHPVAYYAPMSHHQYADGYFGHHFHHNPHLTPPYSYDHHYHPPTMAVSSSPLTLPHYHHPATDSDHHHSYGSINDGAYDPAHFSSEPLTYYYPDVRSPYNGGGPTSSW